MGQIAERLRAGREFRASGEDKLGTPAVGFRADESAQGNAGIALDSGQP